MSKLILAKDSTDPYKSQNKRDWYHVFVCVNSYRRVFVVQNKPLHLFVWMLSKGFNADSCRNESFAWLKSAIDKRRLYITRTSRVASKRRERDADWYRLNFHSPSRPKF